MGTVPNWTWVMTGNKQTDDEEARTPTDVKFVGPATAEVLASASFDAAAILDKQVSYEMLVSAGVNPGVASKLRRAHSLAWSFDGTSGENLTKRSAQVRGLQDDERAWVAASTGDWEKERPTTTAEADGSGEAEAAEAAWRKRSEPEPVTEVSDVTEADAEELAKAGITSVRSLATSNPESVADVLGLDVDTVSSWRDEASDLT